VTDSDDRELVEAGLVDGLDGDARQARLALLRELRADGVGIDELRAAVEEQRLPLLPVDRILSGEEQLTAREAAERAGVSEELVLALRQAAGHAVPEPDERAFDERDVESLRLVGVALDGGVPEQGVLEITRVFSRGLAQGAEALRTLMATTFADAGVDERELSLRIARATTELLPAFAPQLEYMLRRQLREQVLDEAIDLAELQAGTSPSVRPVAVAFADVVGFTRLGERIEADEIGGLVGRLTELAASAAVRPARLVKTIGDAVMFVGPEPGPVLDTALAIVREADAAGDGFPRLRAGVAMGNALSREGDWYGRPVNLASRATGAARAGSVLATREVRDALGETYAWSAAGDFKLKGVKGRVPLWRARDRAPA
jgi:adenylate cyclase